jgi:hypothetical protein
MFLGEEFEEAFYHFKDAQNYLDMVDEGLKIRFLNTIIVNYNRIGTVLASKIYNDLENAL